MQDFSVVRTQGSSTRFLFSYHSATPENLFKGYFFTTRADFGVLFSINFISFPAFLGFWKALEQGAMSSVSVVRRRIVLTACGIWFSCMYNFISNIFFVCLFQTFTKASLLSAPLRHAFPGMSLKTLNKLAAHVLSGPNSLAFSLWF